jgi:hypothetical protein
VHADPRTTRGLPGSRIPHYWLERDGERVSTLDLTGRWLLIAGPQGQGWIPAAHEAADMFGGLSALALGSDLHDPAGGCCEALGIAATGAILVRPDGFVAWRTDTPGRDPTTALREAMARALA